MLRVRIITTHQFRTMRYTIRVWNKRNDCFLRIIAFLRSFGRFSIKRIIYYICVFRGVYSPERKEEVTKKANSLNLPGYMYIRRKWSFVAINFRENILIKIGDFFFLNYFQAIFEIYSFSLFVLLTMNIIRAILEIKLLITQDELCPWMLMYSSGG